jgi:ATP-dependent DNA helicase HFM1/MER3
MLPILVTTSTLAMGVNLPAHLVIIKATQQYIGGSYKDYTDTQILQMIGRAGRPQFDTSAVAVIMTRELQRYYYFLEH